MYPSKSSSLCAQLDTIYIFATVIDLRTYHKSQLEALERVCVHSGCDECSGTCQC